MERAPPALAADDHPPSPPPPPTPAPFSLPGTPADYPTPVEHSSPQPDSPTPQNPTRPRRSARFLRDSDHANDNDRQNTSDHSRDQSPSEASKLVTTDNDTTHSPRDHQNSPNSNDTPNPDTEKTTENDKPNAESPQPELESNHLSSDQPNLDNEDTQPPETATAGDPTLEREHAAYVTKERDEDETQMETDDPDKSAANPSDGDAPDDNIPADEPETSDTRKTTEDTPADEQTAKDMSDAADNPGEPSAVDEPNPADKPDAVDERDAADERETADERNEADEPIAGDNVMNDDDISARPFERENDDDGREAEPASADAGSPTADSGDGVEKAAEEPRTEAEASAIEKPPNDDEDDAMDVDQPEAQTGELERERDSAMEVDQTDEAREGQENPVEVPAGERVTDDSRKGKSVGDSPGDVTDSEDEMRPEAEEAPKPQSPPPSPPMTRRRLATKVPTPPESPPITTRARAETPKTAPHKSSRRSSSSEDVVEIEKPSSSRYETRSSARGSSPMRTRRRRHSEPAPVSEPVVKSRTRGKKKYARKPVKGDRLRVMWHIDNIYYEGVVDSVLAFRGKRFYDITYDSGEREYYLELTHRKWRFADGRDGDEEDEEDDDDDLLQRDIDYSKYPQIGDRILVMWHVDGKYYPGKVNDILKANGAWFYDVNYEGGDREFFLDLTIRKWKYPEDPEEAGKHPLVDRKIPKSAPKPKPKPKAKPKPKRVARKSIGPGSSAFAGDASPPQSPPRPSRRNRTLQKLLDDDDGGIDITPTQEESEAFRKKPSRVDEVLDELDRTPPTGRDKDYPLGDELNKPPESGTDQRAEEDQDEDMDGPGFDVIFDNFGKDLFGQKTSASQRKDTSVLDTAEKQRDPERVQRGENDRNEDMDGASFDVVFDNFGNSTMDVLDEMRPPLSSQSVLKRPRAPAPTDTAREAREKEMDPVDMSDIFGDLLKKPALPLPTSPSDRLPPSRPRVLAERRTLAQRDRPLSPLKPQPPAPSRPRPKERPTPAPVQSLLKRKLAEQSSGAPLAKRQATKPRPVPKPMSAPQPRRLKTIEPTPAAPEKPKEPSQSGADPNVSDIVSVAGVVAKKWAREEAGRISSGIDQLRRHLSSMRTMHSKSLIRSRRKQRTAVPDATILPDDEAEPQINTLGTSIVALVRKYRDTVEEREKKLKNQFTRMRTKITGQNESLIETADVLSGLDIVGLEALNGLQPKVRKKLEVPPPLPSRQGSQAYTQPPAYALSTGVSHPPYQGSPGSLGQQNDAVVRNLRRRLADLVTRSEWLGDEVKRLQGREKTLFREKTSALSELRKAKRATAIVDLTANGRGRGTRASGRSSLPAGKIAPQKPVGITKRRTRASQSAATAPSPSASKGSGKALRKTLPRSNSKYKAPSPESQALVEQTQGEGPEVRIVPPNASTVPPSVTPPPQAGSTAQSGAIPPASSTPAVDASKARNVPSTLQVQMDKQASDLVSLTFTVWLLQDESRNEPPNAAGERMDTWVRGCVKKCLSSALTFLAASGGIFRARSNLKADVDNENIYTDWIMAAPTDDESIENARGNYALWDPSLRDSEWQAEKRVLRGLNICYQKALSMTPAANYSATLMYAKAVLNKAITDFESFMPRTITVLPSKRSTPLSSGQQTIVAQVADPAKPIQPRPQGVRQTTEKGNEQNQHTKRNVKGTGEIRNKSKTQSGSKIPDNQASDSIVVAKSGQAPATSVANTVGSSTVSPTIPSSSAKSAEVTSSASVVRNDATGKVGKEADGTSQVGQETQAVTAPTAAAQAPSGSGPKESASSQGNESPIAAAGRTPSAAGPQSSAVGNKSLHPGSTGSPQKEHVAGPQAESTQEQTPSTGGAAKNVTQGKSVKGSSQEKAKPSSSNQSAAGPTQSGKGSSQEQAPEANSVQTNQSQVRASTKSLDKPGKKKSSGNAAPATSPQRPGAKGGNPAASETPSASHAIAGGNVTATGTQSSSVQPAASRVRNVGTPSPGVKGSNKTGRTTSKQPRAQGRSQRKGGSSGQAKGSRKQTQQGGQNASTSIPSSAAISGGQSAVENQASRLQEIPRKQIALSAARAPLELPRVNNAPSSGAQASTVGVTGTTGGLAQRTYPMLSRNQVRVTNALPSAPMLSRNQVIAGKRPQVGVAQMTVPAAPQRRVAPGMQSSGMYGPSHETDPMEIDAGRDVNSRRNDANPMEAEHHDIERGTGVVANDIMPTTQSHPPFPDDPENAPGIYTSSPPLNVLGRRQAPGTSFQQSVNKRQVGFKSLPQMALRQSSQPDVATDAVNLPQLGMRGRVGQNPYEAQRATSGPLELARTSETHGSEYPYGQGTEPVYSPYNPAGHERDLHNDLMNPPTPSSFAGLDGYGISLGADQVNLQRGESLPATPSDFDRYGIQSPINLERQNSRGTPQQQVQVHGQSQGQLGHIMNPQRHDGGGFSQPQRYQGRGAFPGRG